MRLLIQKDLHYYEGYICDMGVEWRELEKESLLEVSKILTQLGVQHHITNDLTHFSIRIPVQKVTLDEKDMNWLFSDVLMDFPFRFDLKYVFLGGKGCEFCLEITDARN